VDLSKEMLEAWFEPFPLDAGAAGVRLLGALEARARGQA